MSGKRVADMTPEELAIVRRGWIEAEARLVAKKERRPQTIVEAVHHEFKPYRPVTQYLGQQGHEPSGLMLPYAVLDSHAEAIARDEPEMYVVTGEYVRSDGKTFLEVAINPEWIEACTAYTFTPKNLNDKPLRYPRPKEMAA